MSWNGFVKAVNRATTTVMQSAGAVEKTVDNEFEQEEARFRQFESRIELLHRETKGYLDAVRKMTIAQQGIAETLAMFYDDKAPLAKAAKAYRETMMKLDQEVRSELDNTYRITVMEPTGKLVGTLPFVNEAIKKRNKKLLDYDRARTSMKKLAERPSEDPSKMAKAEAEANATRNLYEPLNSQLVREIPMLIEMQVPYFEPSFEAMVKSQLAFNEGAYHKLDAIRKSFPADSDRGLEGRVENVLEQMRELSICRSHH